MSRRFALSLLGTILSASLILVGCSISPSGKELLLEDFAQAYSAEFCSKLYTCCDTAELTDLQGSNYTDETTCTTYFAGLTGQYLVTPMQTAITADRGDYNAKTAASCLDAYIDRGCAGAAENDLGALQGACEDFYVGLQAADAACDSSLECVDGYYCASDVCTAFAAQDAACTAGETICAAGLYCDGSNCVARLSSGNQCLSNAQCQAGLVCDSVSGECTQPDPICDGQ